MSCNNGIPGDAFHSVEEAIGWDYTPTKMGPEKDKDNRTQTERASDIVRFFKGKEIPIEFGIAVAGVWSAESGIKNWRYNNAEHENGYAYKNKIAPNAETIKYNGNTYYKDKNSMMAWGYGKGLAQWSWTRNFKFRDWYNGNGQDVVTTPNLNSMDQNAANITATSVSTQTAFAWKEMQERTGEFMDVVKYIIQNPANDKETFKKNVVLCVDAVLRGFENGGTKCMASTKQIDKYTWSGGYFGAMKTRVSRALGVAEALKSKYQRELENLI